MKKMLITIILILVVQVVCFVLPMMLLIEYLIGLGLVLNCVISWLLIKKVEKGYYSKYNKLSSMLYMLCPIIGVSLLVIVFYLIYKEAFIMNYYLILMSSIYCINGIYVMNNYIDKK